MSILKKLSGIIQKYDPLTLSRIEQIEEVHIRTHLAQHENATASDRAVEMYMDAWNNSTDIPRESKPWGRTSYYRLVTPTVTISSWNKEKLVKSIIDNKRINRKGQVVPLYPDAHLHLQMP